MRCGRERNELRSPDPVKGVRAFSAINCWRAQADRLQADIQMIEIIYILQEKSTALITAPRGGAPETCRPSTDRPLVGDLTGIVPDATLTRGA